MNVDEALEHLAEQALRLRGQRPLREFAPHAGVGYGVLWKIENARAVMTDQVIAFANKVRVPVSILLGEELPDYPVEAEQLIRLAPQLTRSNIAALCVMAEELIASQAEATARRSLPRAAEDESEYRARPPADEDAAYQGTDTGS